MDLIDVHVLGAGVAGLTAALLLSRNPRYRIVVSAKHMPGDYDIDYASPWAGANYMPVSKSGTEASEWDRETWPFLEDLARNHLEAGVHFQECEIYTRSRDTQSATAQWFSDLLSVSPWFKDVVPNFRVLDKKNFGPDIEHATAFTSVCINTAIYLPWLVSRCVKAGVKLRRATFEHIEEATRIGAECTADVVINCTGLGAATLGGVLDKTVVPARGQIVLVRNETGGRMMNFSGTDDGDDEACYIMERAIGGGTVIGGSYQKENWNTEVDLELANRILERAVKVFPALTGGSGKAGDLDIVRHGVGLRPVRDGGARVERERASDGVWIVHNYGHGGAGYQSSYGCAMAAVRLIEEIAVPRVKL